MTPTNITDITIGRMVIATYAMVVEGLTKDEAIEAARTLAKAGAVVEPFDVMVEQIREFKS